MIAPSFLSAFVYSIEKTMNSMLGATCWPSTAARVPTGTHLGGIVYLSGRCHGRLLLSLPRTTATRVVAEMLGVSDQDVPERLLRDGIAEFTNIVAGNAKALLSDSPYAFQVSLPRVVMGTSEFPGASRTAGTADKYFETSLGPLAMAVWLTEVSELSRDGTS
jgi:CheY-specific phosphatase CheX